MNLRRGIARALGSPPIQKLPITSDILFGIRSMLCFSLPQDIAFWAACLVAFFGLLRKSSLLPKSESDPGSISLQRRDLVIHNNNSFEIVLRHSKTNQFGNRVFRIPFGRCSGSRLCPVEAIFALHMIAPKGYELPLFSYKSRGSVRWWTYSSFTRRLKLILCDLGLDHKSYSGHSFRRGGATMCFRAGLNMVEIKNRGDWRSNAVERYIFLDETYALHSAQRLVEYASCYAC